MSEMPSQELCDAVYSVYQAIGFDLPDDMPPTHIVEICLDASRLQIEGFTKEHEEWIRLVKSDVPLEELYVNIAKRIHV